jgi:NAD(P)-dependent dehydrogenase (short-subunit alcohol dehydrogenase family)
MSHSNSQRVIVIGYTGLIGSAIVQQLSRAGAPNQYEVVGVTHATKPGLDLEDPSSIRALFDQVGRVDHVVVAAGDARFGALAQLDDAAFAVGLRSKLMGQVHVALAALARLPEGGSVTLTSGALSHTPIVASAAVALVNGAVDSFVKAAALETPPGRRINVVSPGWIRETRIRMGLDPEPGTSALDVAKLYVVAIESDLHGQVLSTVEG